LAKFNLKLRQNRNEADYEADEIVTAEGALGFHPRTAHGAFSAGRVEHGR